MSRATTIIGSLLAIALIHSMRPAFRFVAQMSSAVSRANLLIE